MRSREVTVRHLIDINGSWEDREVSVECQYRPGTNEYFSNTFGNFLPGDWSEFLWDASTFMIDGVKASIDQIKKLESDERLMLKFEEEIRNDD